jgi:hypothetical protein
MFKKVKMKWHSLATIDRMVTVFLLIGLCGVTGCILWDTENEVAYKEVYENESDDIIKDSYHWDLDLTPNSLEKSL